MMVKDVVANLDAVRGYDADEFTEFVLTDSYTKERIDARIDDVMDKECIDAYMVMGGFVYLEIRQ